MRERRGEGAGRYEKADDDEKHCGTDESGKREERGLVAWHLRDSNARPDVVTAPPRPCARPNKSKLRNARWLCRRVRAPAAHRHSHRAAQRRLAHDHVRMRPNLRGGQRSAVSLLLLPLLLVVLVLLRLLLIHLLLLGGLLALLALALRRRRRLALLPLALLLLLLLLRLVLLATNRIRPLLRLQPRLRRGWPRWRKAPVARQPPPPPGS